jgi:nitrite reductase/ring-hydroxylating ferredoxin subunit
MTDIPTSQLRLDLKRNWGLPTLFYASSEIHNKDIQSIFRKRWQYFCPAVRVQEQGDTAVGFAGDVPIVVARGDDGVLRGFVNMCRHRGYRVAHADQKNCKRLVCRYHAWSYWTDGTLANAPGSQDEQGFPKDDLGLKPVSVMEWGPMILVNPDADAPEFFDAHPEIESEAARIGMDLDLHNYDFVREEVAEVASNWKVWYDNFVECYHCDNIHRGSFAAAYESDVKSVDTRYCKTFMASRFAPKADGTKVKLRADNYRSLSIFPGFLFLQQDELMILSQMRPLGPEVTEQKVHYFAPKGSDPQRVEDWIELWEQTFAEDGEAVAIQQSGLRTGIIERNRLLPGREEAVLFFNGLVIDAYGDGSTDA